MSVQFAWGAEVKDVSSIWVGTSPEFELALYTLVGAAQFFTSLFRFKALPFMRPCIARQMVLYAPVHDALSRKARVSCPVSHCNQRIMRWSAPDTMCRGGACYKGLCMRRLTLVRDAAVLCGRAGGERRDGGRLPG